MKTFSPQQDGQTRRPTAIAAAHANDSGSSAGTAPLLDGNPGVATQLRLDERLNRGPRTAQLRTMQMLLNHAMPAQPQKDEEQPGTIQMVGGVAGQATRSATDPEPNRTGLPDRLKAGVEALSGLSMDDVRVHYDSSRPAQLQALAYTQGSDIHVAPGQERHLAHEAWHVVQQKQGRVRPTLEVNGTDINDHPGLESEADAMGRKATQLMGAASGGTGVGTSLSGRVVQRTVEIPEHGTQQAMVGIFEDIVQQTGGPMWRIWQLAKQSDRLTLRFVGSEAPHGYGGAHGATDVMAYDAQGGKWDSIANKGLEDLEPYRANPHVLIDITYRWMAGQNAGTGKELYALVHEFSVHAIHAWPRIVNILSLSGDVGGAEEMNGVGTKLDDQHNQHLAGDNPHHAALFDRALAYFNGIEQFENDLNAGYADDLVVQSQNDIIHILDRMEQQPLQQEYERIRDELAEGIVRVPGFHEFLEQAEELADGFQQLHDHYVNMAAATQQRNTKFAGHEQVHTMARTKLLEMAAEKRQDKDDVMEVIEELQELYRQNHPNKSIFDSIGNEKL